MNPEKTAKIPDYRDLLKDEFLARLARNPQYSLRAFARNIGLVPSRVSLLFSHQQGLSKQRALQIGKKLGYNKDFLSYFSLLVEARHARSKTRRQAAIRRLKPLTEGFHQHHLLDQDVFRTISDWWHIAILQLGKLEGFSGEISWISNRLGLSEKVISESVERLCRLKLVRMHENKVEIISDAVTTTDGVPSTSIRSFHHQILKMAITAIDEQQNAERNISSLLVPFDLARMPIVLDKIREFKETIDHECELGERKTEVYCLGVQFFKITNS